MLDLIGNTLSVIAKLSNSKSSYLFKATKVDFEILSYYGEDPSNYNSLNSVILSHHNSFDSSGLNDSSNIELKRAAAQFGINSFQIIHLLNCTEKHFKVYLVLLFSKDGAAGNSSSEIFNKVMKTLNYQIREWANSSDLLEDGVKFDRIFSTPTSNDSEIDQQIFFDISDDFLFILDREGKFLKVNKKGAESINYSLGKLLGKHFLDIIEESSKSTIQQLLKDVLQSKKEMTFEVTFTDELGECFQYMLCIRTLCKADKICGLAGAAKNINEIKKLESQLAQLTPKLIESERLLSIERRRAHQQKSILVELNKLKNEFISNISHELRTPLASIIGFSETIESDNNLPEDMRKDFNRIILSEGKRLAKLINDVLELSRIESGAVSLNKSNFELTELIKEVIFSCKPEILPKNIFLTEGYPEKEIMLFADRDKIAQAISSVLSNAIKFTEKNGRITVIINDLMNEAEIIITDTGVGIPEKDLPFIFEKFFKVQRKDSEISGTGLGLVFVKEIVDLHKGYVEIQSEINKGTSVLIRLLKSLKINLNAGT